MKKTKNFLVAIIATASIITLASCSSTDEDVLSIDPTIQTNGIATDLGGGVFASIVSGDGVLTVEIPETGAWVSYDESKAEKGDLTLIVEENFTGIDRSTTVKISGGGTSYDIPVKQSSTMDGEDATNDEASFANVAKNKGLGFGYNIKEFKKTNTVFNMKRIQYKQENDESGEVGDLILEDVNNELKSQSAQVDSIENKKDTLGVSLACDISYGLFKFGISGKYESAEKRYTATKEYNVGAKVPALTSTLDCNSILELSKEDEKLLSLGFRSLRSNIEKLAGESKTADDATMKECLQKLCDSYGAMFVSGSTLGGLLALHVETDSIYCKEKMAVDTAKVTAAISAGLLKIDAGVEVSYEKESVEILNHSNVSLEIKGGDATKYGSLICANLGRDTQSEMVNEWIQTINLSDNNKENNTEVVSLDLRPIWTLFDDASDIVRNYVLDKFADVKELNVYRTEQ